MPVAAAASRPRPGADGQAGASEEAGPASAPSTPKKSLLAGRRKLVVAAAPLLLGLVGVGLWYSGMLGRLMGNHGKTKADATTPELFAMPQLIANLSGDSGTERYVKVDIRLVVAGRSALALVRSHEPELQDMFLSYLRDMRADELARPTSTWRLREDLLDRAAVIVGPGRVTNVLFTTLLVQ